MKLITVEFLQNNGLTDGEINWFARNKIIGMPYELVDTIKQECYPDGQLKQWGNLYFPWLKNRWA